MPAAQETEEGGEHEPKHAEVHPGAGPTAVLIVKDVDQTGWVLLQDEQADLLQGTTDGANALGKGLGKKEEKGNQKAARNENCFHAQHLHHSASTSPTKVATIAPMPMRKPIR